MRFPMVLAALAALAALHQYAAMTISAISKRTPSIGLLEVSANTIETEGKI